MAEELLVDLLSGDPGLVPDEVLGEHLVRRLQVNFDVLEHEAGIERVVQKAENFAIFRLASIFRRSAANETEAWTGAAIQVEKSCK